MGPREWETVIPGCIDPQTGVPTIKCLEAVFANVLSVVATLAGIALFVMLTIGALRYLTSGGDPKATEAARKTMTSAILGITLIVGSYLILRLISSFTGLDLLKFEIPTFSAPTPTP